MFPRRVLLASIIIVLSHIGLVHGQFAIEQPVNNLSCDLKMDFNSLMLQRSTTILAKVYLKQPDKFMLCVYHREPIGGASIFSFEPVGFAILRNHNSIARYHLLSHDDWKSDVATDKVAGAEFDMMELHTLSSLNSVLQNILSVNLADYVREESTEAIQWTHKHDGGIWWGHRIKVIRVWVTEESGCLERVEYYNMDDILVAELKALNPVRLPNGQWVPTEIITVVREGRLTVSNTDITIAAYANGAFKEERADGEIPYPTSGLIVHRYFEIFDDFFWLPSRTKYFTGTSELLATSEFSNYHINKEIADSVFSEANLLNALGMSDVRGEFLRTRIAFVQLQRNASSVADYQPIISSLESLRSSDDAEIASQSHYLCIQLLLKQKNYEKSFQATISLLDFIASSDSEKSGPVWASGSAHGFAARFLEAGQFSFAQKILDKYVEYQAKTGGNLLEVADMDLKGSDYFHAIKLYEYISKQTKSAKMKAQCHYATAVCYDMIARESIDTSKWYQTDDQKRMVVKEALARYKAFVETYPSHRYTPWANRYAEVLASYPVKTKPANASESQSSVEKQVDELSAELKNMLYSKRPQWTEMQAAIYSKNVVAVLKHTLPGPLTQQEYRELHQSLAMYVQTALPERLDSIDELATEVASIRWSLHQYGKRRGLSNEATEAEINWQISQLIQEFDDYVETHLSDETFDKTKSQVKKDHGEALKLYRENVLYPVFKSPMSPRTSWRYQKFVIDQQQRKGQTLTSMQTMKKEMMKKAGILEIGGPMESTHP